MPSILNIFVTLFSLFLFTTKSIASDSDATWEETISFIGAKQDYAVYHTGFYGDTFRGNRYPLTSSSKIKSIHGNTLSLIDRSENHGTISTNVPLDKIASISTGSNDNYIKGLEFSVLNIYPIVVRFTGDYVCTTSRKYEVCNDRLGIEVNDFEMRSRLRNAFEHLAKLAREARKKRRQQSGEKF